MGATGGLSTSALGGRLTGMGSIRKTVRRGHEPGDCHELTFSYHGRMPLLKNETWCTMLGHSVSQAMRHHDFGLAAFVFMPEHVHLLVFPRGPDPRIDLLLKAIKRPFSWRIKRALTRVKSSLLKRLTVRERPGVEGFRFWQEGGGYDRNLRTGPTVLAAITYIHVNPVRRGLCELFVLKSYYIYTSQIQRALNGSTD